MTFTVFHLAQINQCVNLLKREDIMYKLRYMIIHDGDEIAEKVNSGGFNVIKAQ